MVPSFFGNVCVGITSIMVPSVLCTFLAYIIFLHVFFVSPSLSLSLPLSLHPSLPPSLPPYISLYLCLSVVARHVSSDAFYQAAQCICMDCHKYALLNQSYLLFHTISFHSSYKIHQLFTDYFLRLPSSELPKKHLFRSRANRRLVFSAWTLWTIQINGIHWGASMAATIRSWPRGASC